MAFQVVQADRDRIASRLAERVRELGAAPFSSPGPGVTRYPFTPPYERTVARVADLMRDAGLEPARDVVGNMVGRPPAAARGVGLGSHLDSVRGGGAWDGALGVLAGIEAARIAGDLGLSAIPRVVFSDPEVAAVGRGPSQGAGPDHQVGSRRERPAGALTRPPA